MNSLFKLSGIVFVSLFAFMGAYLLKITLNKIIPAQSSIETLCRTMPHIFFETKFWFAVVCYGSAMIIYLFLLQGDQISKIFPLTVGMNILLTTVGAMFFLGDKIDISRAIGLLFIVIGIFLINGLTQWK